VTFAMLVLVLSICVYSADTRAETIAEISVESTYDSNVFGTSTNNEDYLTQAGTYIAHREKTEESDFHLFYAGTAYLFTKSTDRSFSMHDLGVSYSRKLGDGRNRLYAGSTFRARLDRDIFTVYDFDGFLAFVNTKFYATPRTMLRVGYSMERRNYWNLDVSGYSDQNVFLQATRFFPSRTTLRGDLSYGQKDYAGSEGQVLMGLQVAQGLSGGTGVSVRFQRRINVEPGDAGNALSADEDILFDRYDYGGNALSLTLTQQLPFAARLIVNGAYESQSFNGQLALDENLIPLSTFEERVDRISGAGLFLELPLTSRLELGLGYDFERSRSNDATYDYEGRHIVSVGFDLDF